MKRLYFEEDFFIEFEDSEKTFEFIDIYPSITYEEEGWSDYDLYTPDYLKKCWNRGQLVLTLTPCSLEQLFELMQYLTEEGWARNFVKSSVSWNWTEPRDQKRHIFNIEYEVKNYKTFMTTGEDGGSAFIKLHHNLGLDIRVDKRELNNFRETLKNFKKYKFYWLVNYEGKNKFNHLIK